MSEWVYKATTTKISHEDTENLAMKFNFLARSAFTRTGARPARVGKVMPDDIIHFYYRLRDGHVETVGSFRVIDGGTRFPHQFSGYVAKTALVGVKETSADLIRELEKDHKLDPSKGYARDPVLKIFTGWAIERLDGVHAPEFDQGKLFPGAQITLWQYPSPKPTAKNPNERRHA
ncbi:hypothetical protein [Sorangium sp. So ce388]|uniref:hypothetical protein n=1 Tax=Sorangium sp. So ce388 TaxID=3133309 RepID=UPI003F5B18A3